jgi:Putative Ig domain
MKSSVGKYSARIPSSVHSTLPSTLDVRLGRGFRLRWWWWAVVIPAVLSLGMLGCGGGGSKPQPPQPPSNLVYPQTAIAATVGVAITPDVPTVTGSVTSFSVSPALPAGLSLDGSTGTISGTPTAATGQASYVITAANSAGSTSATIQITVMTAVTPPSNLVYPQTTITATIGVAITPDVPTFTGMVTSFSVSPALPAGLSLDNTTGTISGTPTASSSPVTYTVTASNSAGSTSATVTIQVNAPPTTLLRLGHTNPVSFIRFDGARVLSQDSSGYWVFWDYASGQDLADGNANSVDMAGTTVVVATASTLEILSYQDGHLLTTITSPSSFSWWKVASDGSYVCAGSTAGLSIWNLSGQQLVSKAGDYSKANSFAEPGDVRVALGPAGAQVIEIVATDGTSSVTPPFSGQFNSWFLDGGRFLTNVSTSVFTYSKDAVQQSAVVLPSVEQLTGQGNWMWTYQTIPGYPLAIYPVNTNTPAATYSLTADTVAIGSGLTIGILPFGEADNSVVDLSGSTPSKVDYALPVAYLSTYGASSSGQWLIGNHYGVLLDGASLSSTPRYLGMGEAWSIAGGTSRVAIATANGSITVMDPSTQTIEATISFPSSKLEMSLDSGTLGAMANANDDQYEPDRTLKILALPTGGLINSWPYVFEQGPFLFDFTLSGAGNVVGQVLATSTSNGLTYSRQATADTGGPIIWSDTGSSSPILISPNGSLIATRTEPANENSTTNIFLNGVLMAAVPGWAVGWIDDSRLLVNSYVVGCRGLCVQYTGCTVYNANGVALSTPPLPNIVSLQPVTSDWIYAPPLNAIYSVSSGALIWMNSDQATTSAVSGPYIVYSFGSQVLAKSY